MGKSQETFRKKDVQKRKEKKRQDKEKKKLERKGNETDNNMIAYVDEFGRITSEPPDPNKKKSYINPDNIEIKISRKTENETENKIREGKIVFFNDNKGYGFIRDLVTQESIFVHMENIQAGVRFDENVTFEVKKGPRGPVATDVKQAQKNKGQ